MPRWIANINKNVSKRAGRAVGTESLGKQNLSWGRIRDPTSTVKCLQWLLWDVHRTLEQTPKDKADTVSAERCSSHWRVTGNECGGIAPQSSRSLLLETRIGCGGTCQSPHYWFQKHNGWHSKPCSRSTVTSAGLSSLPGRVALTFLFELSKPLVIKLFPGQSWKTYPITIKLRHGMPT